MHIRVVPPDPDWPQMYLREAAQIRGALGPALADLHHIGSTSIPGIFAKPVIDILLETTDTSALDAIIPAMQSLGYESKGEFGIPRRRYFRRDDPSGVRSHQVHAFARGDSHVRRHLAFRDYIIAHPDIAAEYSALKQQLATLHPDDIYSYMDGKDPFIKLHETRALDWAAAT